MATFSACPSIIWWAGQTARRGGYHPPAFPGTTNLWGATTRRAVRRGDLWSPGQRRPGLPAGACPAGAPISSRRNGGKEGPGGSAHPGPPNPGVHGGGGLYRQGKDQPCIAARSLGIYVTGAAAPRVARIAVTLQALGAGALYQLGPPGRRRCHASEIPWRSRQLSVGRDDPARRPWGTGPTQNAETPCGIYAARPAQPLSSFAG